MNNGLVRIPLPSPQNQHSKFQFVVESAANWVGLLEGECVSVLGTLSVTFVSFFLRCFKL